MTDISAILTVHDETVVAGPTIGSAELAIARAEAAGYSVERLIGLDAPSDACKAYFAQDSLSNWRRETAAFKDQGRARNSFAEKARGRWIAFLDGDDLWSENWLVEAARMLEDAEGRDETVIVHPELNWVFDRRAQIMAKIGQDDPLFSPHYFYFTNHYDTLCIAARKVFLDFPYAHRDIENGFAFEDLQWNIETMAAGLKHVIARDTIIFKRRRNMSQTIRAGQRGATIRDLEPLKIDRIDGLGRR